MNNSDGKIFWDIDETLIYTCITKPDQDHITFALDGFWGVCEYHTIIRPTARELISFSRNLVGRENVYILTASTTDYANEVNRLGLFGFDRDHIICRSEIHDHTLNYGRSWGPEEMRKHELYNPSNVLIDDLPYEHNPRKIGMMGIKVDNYFQLDKPYYGVNYPDDDFESTVKLFLSNRFPAL